MDIEKYLKKQKFFEQEFGVEKFKEMLGVISEAFKRYNLDITPTTMDEIYQHVKETIHLEKI